MPYVKLKYVCDSHYFSIIMYIKDIDESKNHYSKNRMNTHNSNNDNKSTKNYP